MNRKTIFILSLLILVLGGIFTAFSYSKKDLIKALPQERENLGKQIERERIQAAGGSTLPNEKTPITSCMGFPLVEEECVRVVAAASRAHQGEIFAISKGGTEENPIWAIVVDAEEGRFEVLFDGQGNTLRIFAL
ncbi:MAG: hypothetical protein A3C82_00875 [Candidatus Wildermuthbacteria bacterium RIFCSPHIGHO2_02_FULL_47_12]|uniref:Uncharacterized protein n=1 Tax=Candidatus Wildermuthbacteria bacterium RIFCSPHIGHO2_02_FULL_47_12 TaxID=1802451 RepID=A0A1G2R2Z7_9BACT|nr:MAG: hypothetical protein A3C82_00875 [Candidatus Wildermuthbacteria bacterium RIFCSPHIGHO2_02_FULL_47_12]